MIGIRSDKIILENTLFDGYVYLENGKIASVANKLLDCDTIYDYTGKYVSPGLIDLHTHGAGGHGFTDTSPEEVIKGCNVHLSHGTTTILPTVMAAPFDVMQRSLQDIAAAKKSGQVKSNLIGAHLEVPYLSAAQAGAQCPTYITPPNPEEYETLIGEYGADIARWTYAPENDPDGTFAAYLHAHGILPSAGHTNAKYPDVATAIEQGMRLITHLYSCTSTVTRDHGFRSLGVIESAFLRDELYVEIIADGKHLPPELVRMIVKIKGMDKVALVTDSLDIAATDLREGQFKGGSAFIVEDGVCKLPDRTAFAGSIATADRLVRVMRDECGFDIIDAVRMMTATPAALLALHKGSLRAGMDADIIVFDESINVSDVFVGGIKMI
ncbi:MAG: N-acetylglucosamine-6-phosphate deacetylase [Clostridia bacterium]|nr:N-acetylglucosamine-6-phosphate deacetylase [Clostridia bacterium]